MATATPTIKGYGRYRPHMLAPDRATTAGSRCAYSVGPAIRVENRIGEPAADGVAAFRQLVQLSTAPPGFYVDAPPLSSLDRSGVARIFAPKNADRGRSAERGRT